MRVCMREYARLFWANLPIRTTITNSTRGGARLGLLTLPTAGEREQVRGAREERCYALVCMSNHPDLTSNHLQSF